MRIIDTFHLLREMGPAWLFWRGLYELKLRSGILRRRFKPQEVHTVLARSLDVAPRDLDDYLIRQWQKSASRFFLSSNVQRYRKNIVCPAKVLEVADSALEGRFLFFSRWYADLGDPPDWLLNPVDGVRYPEVHWSLIPDLSPELGDIKYVWEASRFPQVYYFVRAYALTGDERYAEGFWKHIESWVDANPPEVGPNWRCGQEIAIRSLAWIFGMYAFKECAASTPERISLVIKYLWYNAWHIESNHWYALRCIRNNHTLSEAAGMFTIGTLFPFFKESMRWKQKGFQHLTQEAMRQIYSDGTYMQHSMNYARLVVQLFTWCLRIGELNGVKFPSALRERLCRLLNFLYSVQDKQTGRVPNYGSNDGALIFPLSSCDYLDYRPSLNALNRVLKGERLYDRGPWDEEGVWFCGTGGEDTQSESGLVLKTSISTANRTPIDVSVQAEKMQDAFPIGGYYILRGQDSFAMIRCGRYIHRPSQADMLHVDLWYKGHNVLVDPGTYSYNPRGGWIDYFVGTGSHNTVTVDNLDQMKRGSRFLWSNWVKGKMLRFGETGCARVFAGEHTGYSPVVHRRLVAQKEDSYLIIDYLFGDEAEHEYALHWLVGNEEIMSNSSGALIFLDESRLLLRTGCSETAIGTWARGQENPKRGWQSLYYGEKTPAWSYRMTVRTSGVVRFFTLIQPVSGEMKPEPVTFDEVNRLLGAWGLSTLGVVGEPLIHL